MCVTHRGGFQKIIEFRLLNEHKGSGGRGTMEGGEGGGEEKSGDQRGGTWNWDH